jgi:hypothetical protein
MCHPFMDQAGFLAGCQPLPAASVRFFPEHTLPGVPDFRPFTIPLVQAEDLDEILTIWGPILTGTVRIGPLLRPAVAEHVRAQVGQPS